LTQIKATDTLFEAKNDAMSDFFFTQGENHWKSHFVSFRIALHLDVDGRALASFGVTVFRTQSVHVYVSPLRFDKLFVDIRPVSTNFIHVGTELGGAIPNLAKEFLAAAISRGRVIDSDIMMIRIDRLFDKGLVSNDTIDFNMIIVFGDICIIISISAARSRRYVTVAIEKNVSGNINATRFQQVLNLATTLDYFLPFQIIENKGIHQLNILL
jgi:hypothetical protein